MRTLRRGLLLVLVLLLTTIQGWAQTAPRVEWQHDGLRVTRFEIVIDTQAPVDVGLPTPTGTTYRAPLPAVAVGQHTLVVRACHLLVCTPSVPIVLVRLASQVP